MWERYRTVGGFTAAYMVALGAGAVWAGNGEFVLYTLVMGLLIALVFAMDRRVRFSRGVLWLLALWGLLHMAGGVLPAPPVLELAPGAEAPGVLYSWRAHPMAPKYDQVVHFFGFFVATLAAWEALSAAVAGAAGGRVRATAGLLLAAGLIGVGLGAVNEVVEFAAHLSLPETNVGGYENTGWDLVSNALGALAGVAWVRVRAGRAKGEGWKDAPAGA